MRTLEVTSHRRRRSRLPPDSRIRIKGRTEGPRFTMLLGSTNFNRNFPHPEGLL